MSQLLLMMTDGGKTHHDVQRIFSAPEIKRIQSHTHRLMPDKEIDPVSNVEIATIIDVPVLKCKYHH